MKSEQYASDELAEWREKTLKKVQFCFFSLPSLGSYCISLFGGYVLVNV